jgi:hypothetical protein
MASSNNDKTIEYDEEMYKKPNPAKVYLPEFAVKLQEKANRIYIPPPPLTNSAHRSVSEVDVFFSDFSNNQILLSNSSQPDLEYNILGEIRRVYQLIKDHGQQGDFSMQIKFGELIPVSVNSYF